MLKKEGTENHKSVSIIILPSQEKSLAQSVCLQLCVYGDRVETTLFLLEE